MARDAKRVVLDRAAVVAGAVELADEAGLEPLTIRRLADRLGVRPMTMYHYVDGKDDIVDGMVGQVFDEIERPDPGIPWKESIRRRARSLRTALRRHPWAIPLMESRRTPGADILDHHEAVLATWLGAGFELPVVAHGMAVVDAFVYGFALQESALPFGERDGDLAEISGDIAAHLAPDDYPALTRFTAEHVMRPGYDFGDSFEVGLEIVLDGIERLAARSGGQ
ncbi:TetR/AcrR family transcriptional regulator [Microbacterium esteraromaticum]|uniref:TetR/AcrR family transcriptional regulator n=1 Tax=Microbacterium esteraromaticum TaxID=57043 RepID=UPI0019D384DF|nr:TetR/AcrR family transcriptional regulator [Microbacterium esteraromaticum]MBN7793573.1 TetR/AcrR family transcriptional regulator C-terminal domain-containing protein [Microbacterium esteraromaticum]MCA1305318.1 TetR/AcrR family transcriptional regulator [Microbacterium esteraromaticum]